MPGASLVGDVIVRDHASRALKEIGDETKKTHGHFKDFAAGLAGGALAAGLVNVFKSGLGEVKDYQAGLAQAQQVISSTGGAAGVSAKHIEDLAGAIQGYSGQTDDSIVSGENLLLTFTNLKNEAGAGNDIFDQTTKIMADMSQALGQDTKTSALQLGKALNDPIAGISALHRVGVSFTDAQKATIKRLQETGDTAGAQKVILAELTKEFGGSAKAFGESGPGQIEKAKRSFEDLSQAAVTKLLPALTRLMDGFTSMIGFVQRNSDIIVPLAAVLGGLAVGIWAVNAAQNAWRLTTEAWAAVTKVATAVQAAFNVVMDANPIMLVVIAIAALAAGIVIAYKHSETFRDIVHAAFHVVAAAVDFVRDHWKVFATAFATLLGGPVIGGIVLLVTHFGQVKAVAQAVWSAISSAVSTAWGAMKAVFGAIESAGLAVLRAQIGALRTVWSGAWGAIHSAVSATWAALRVVFSSIVSGGVWLVKREIQGLQTVWNTVWDSVKAVVEGVWDFLKPIFDKISKGIGGIVSAAGKIGGVIHKIPGFASGVDNFQGGLAIVGEQGPELVSLPHGSSVTNSRDSLAALAGGGGGEQTIHLVVNLDGRVIAESTHTALLQKKARGGALGLA
jgi:phage-related protein